MSKGDGPKDDCWERFVHVSNVLSMPHCFKLIYRVFPCCCVTVLFSRFTDSRFIGKHIFALENFRDTIKVLSFVEESNFKAFFVRDRGKLGSAYDTFLRPEKDKNNRCNYL